MAKKKAPQEHRRQCKHCPAHIIFARAESGKLIPLHEESSLHVYALNGHNEAGELVAAKSRSYISHFLTCPGATQASKEAKRGNKDNP